MSFGELSPFDLAELPALLKASEKGDGLTCRARWARLLVRQQLAREVNILQSLQPGLIPGKTPWTGGALPPDDFAQEPEAKALKVCIVGAGMSGLYIALILDTLKIPGISFDFFEASDRIGGRCLTYDFSRIPHDYYDIGAMRFPEIKVMDRTFDLFRRTNTETIPYYYSKGTVNCPMLFNNVRHLKSDVSPQWHTNPFRVDGVPHAYAYQNPASIMSEVIKPYVDALNDDFPTGFKKLMEVDHFSVREYLSQKTEYNDYKGIEYLETFAGSTTSFNSAFSEYVIDAIDFAADKWWCIEGGTEVLAENMWKKLITKPQLKKKVIRIALNDSKNAMRVKIEGESEGLPYNTVFCTPALGCMQKMDLRNANLNWGQKSAIRGLTYGPSTKVAIKFSRPWWITDCGIKSAGIGSTDELIRTCVYPSYNLHDGAGAPAVLLCSYSWRQDALRMGSLVHPDSPKGEDELKELLLQGLARLHDISYDVIKPLYVTHHAWNWYQDPNSMGAFAAFGPADFSTLYPYVTRPAGNGYLHFVGEAVSAHHAWIVGALESAYRAVDHFFKKFGLEDAREKLREEFGAPPGELETAKNGTEHLQVILGSLDDEVKKKLEDALLSQ